MIHISPKALRFARLAAEDQPLLAKDPQVSIIRQEENHFRTSLKVQTGTTPRYVEVSEETAAFCVRALTSLLERQDEPASDKWDGNDFEFIKNVTQSMQQQLAPVSASQR